MQLFIDQLLKGIIYSLDQVILPGLSSPYLRAQAIAISSSLRNLATRLASLDQVLGYQNHSLKSIFQSLEKIIDSSPELSNDKTSMELKGKIEGQWAKIYDTKQLLADENYDLKLLLEEIIGSLWEIEDRIAIQSLRELHGQIRQFLKQEVETELSLLTPPDMAQVSKG